jgi:hypothetical protein
VAYAASSVNSHDLAGDVDAYPRSAYRAAPLLQVLERIAAPASDEFRQVGWRDSDRVRYSDVRQLAAVAKLVNTRVLPAHPLKLRFF